MTASSIDIFWDTLVAAAKAACGEPSSHLKSGQSIFRVAGFEQSALDNLKRHFFQSPPDTGAVSLYQFEDRAQFDLALEALGTNWFQKTIIAFRECGLYGFLNEELGLLEAYDPKGHVAIRLLRGKASIPVWENSSPLANFVNWFNVKQHAYMLHAASLSDGSAGLLAVADGGTGKSLLTLSCLEEGLLTVGDDYAVVHQNPSGHFDATCFSRVAKQTAEGLALLGASGTRYKAGTRNFKDKYVFDIPVHPTALPVNAVLLLTRAGDRPTITPAAARDVFAAISRTTFHQLPASAIETQAFAGKLVRDLPTYQFSLGTDLSQNAKMMREFLGDLDA